LTGARRAREVALEAIKRVVDEGAYSNVVIPSLLVRSALGRADRAFATELSYGTLRRLLILDRQVENAARRSTRQISSSALHALRLGAYQLLFMRTPAHAAVSETVSLVGPQERGFVNAVLRRISTEGLAALPTSGDARVEAATGLSSWAVAELRKVVGEEAEVAAGALAERATLSLRVNGCATTPEEVEAVFAGSGVEARAGGLDPDCILVDGGAPSELPGFDLGWFWVQDQASSFVAKTLDPRPGEKVLDLCAAPGGKTMAAACAVEPGGLVVAADVNPARARLIATQAARLGLRPKIVVQDALTSALRGTFDRVLVDAPCSGLGSARRRPELLWRVRREGVGALAARQLAIMEAALAFLKPGGRLVYSVCTYPRAETDAVADELLAGRPDLHPVTTQGPDGPAARHRLWPHRHGTDGMFVAAFETSA
jgi:16S rRNA (cytosine967-C5)-methyltransferase